MWVRRVAEPERGGSQQRELARGLLPWWGASFLLPTHKPASGPSSKGTYSFNGGQGRGCSDLFLKLN